MNENIREAVKQAMQEEDISQVKLADELGVDRVNLTRALNGRSGKVPDLWQKIFEYLGLELSVQPKKKE